ncbi:hypothetical protein ATOBIA_N10520 [Atopobiaceae bacterium P1]|uniref:Uncharacterized protein n=1 Tax=Leptogranulimonas caecicola TaxID=2894156 RepID=A0AAU9CX23_9ACTN|nr:hypothetical protein ATOBIA_N10520 [Atopobiaceae bacterium P1]BDC91093.1 hypothetical protein ATTO_09650 [Leptogranulimonas caecicola]
MARAVDRLNEMGNRRGGKLAPISLIYGTLGRILIWWRNLGKAAC